MNDFAFADIIILALIAVFIALKLRNTLGKDVGHRPDLKELRRQVDEELAKEKVITMPGVKTQEWVSPQQDDAEEEKLMEALTDIQLAAVLKDVRQADEEFRLKEFLEGARVAFEWVLGAFNSAEKEALAQLMSADVYTEFEAVIDDRLQKGVQVESTLVSIQRADIIEASLKQKKARLTVAFVTEQIVVERHEKDGVVAGDSSQVQTIEDEWVFERDLGSDSPNWVIVDI